MKKKKLKARIAELIEISNQQFKEFYELEQKYSKLVRFNPEGQPTGPKLPPGGTVAQFSDHLKNELAAISENPILQRHNCRPKPITKEQELINGGRVDVLLMQKDDQIKCMQNRLNDDRTTILNLQKELDHKRGIIAEAHADKKRHNSLIEIANETVNALEEDRRILRDQAEDWREWREKTATAAGFPEDVDFKEAFAEVVDVYKKYKHMPRLTNIVSPDDFG